MHLLPTTGLLSVLSTHNTPTQVTVLQPLYCSFGPRTEQTLAEQYPFWCVHACACGPLPQIFNDLDVQDDKLMLDLAVFLNRLVSCFWLVVEAWGSNWAEKHRLFGCWCVCRTHWCALSVRQWLLYTAVLIRQF